MDGLELADVLGLELGEGDVEGLLDGEVLGERLVEEDGELEAEEAADGLIPIAIPPPPREPLCVICVSKVPAVISFPESAMSASPA